MSIVTSSTSKDFKIPHPNPNAVRPHLIRESYYYTAKRTGSGNSISWTIKVYRNNSIVDLDRSDSTQVAIFNSNKGNITLQNLNSYEEPHPNHMKREIRNIVKSTLFNLPVTQGLSNEEMNRLKNTSGMTNIATNDGLDFDDPNNPNREGGEVVIEGGSGNDDPKKPKFSFNDININIEGRRFRGSKPNTGYDDLSYPEGLGSNKQDRIRFEQIYSEGKKLGGLDLQGKVFQRQQKRIKGSVTLPIVTGIGDRNQVDWQGASLNPLQALGASGALSLFDAAGNSTSIANAFSDAGSAINEGVARINNKATVGSDIKSAINIYLAQKAVGAQGLLSRASGAILNPNLEMLFSGPSLRNFDFTFKLSPRDADEATQVRKIIRFFKQGMSVKTSSSNVFLKAPNIFLIRYQTFNTSGEEIIHPSINIIKECALKSCDVQYTPDGTYMTYEDPFRTMTSYQLTLSFGELDPIYDLSLIHI